MKKYLSLLLSCLLVFSFAACNQAEKASNADTSVTNGMQEAVNVQFPENFVLIEGGRFGQSLTAISKLVPSAAMGDALSVHYSGGSSLAQDISNRLKENHIAGNE